MANVSAGDLVQIRVGAIDVTNGVVAKSGWKYVDGSSLWMTVEKVVENWKTGGISGLPSTVTKVRCKYGDTVVWQVQPDDIISQVIKADEPVQTTTTPTVQETTTDSGTAVLSPDKIVYKVASSSSNSLYAIKKGAEDWTSESEDGVKIQSQSTTSFDSVSEVRSISTKSITTASNPFGMMTAGTQPTTGGWRKLTSDEQASIGSPNIEVDESALEGATFPTAMDDTDKKAQMLNSNKQEIQNDLGFPYYIKKEVDSDGALFDTAKYDYQIIPNDPRYSGVSTLEDKLVKARAALGIPVHGNNRIARSMKYYLYNRWKQPDLNLVHNKTFTHVFFTRPDLNILVGSGNQITANSQVLNHTEAALIWKRYPEIFKLLTQGSAVLDSNNFNMLLSNQVTSFDMQDESISNMESGKNWNDYSIIYGDAYTGRTAGEFTCNFDEVADFSVINMLKLWITYIDNVARGAWSPSYNLSNRLNGVASSPTMADSYVFQRTLDYAASCYVFKCGPDGEDVLYWSKYYGVFPANTGANSLSWDASTPIGTTPKLSIKFNYSYKKDLSPISLLEFNDNAYVSGIQTSEPGFNGDLGHPDRPYVGAPYIALSLGNPSLRSGGVNYNQGMTQIRLKFRPATTEDSQMTDDLLYRSDLTKASKSTGVQYL